jgi:hypothetical protein
MSRSTKPVKVRENPWRRPVGLPTGYLRNRQTSEADSIGLADRLFRLSRHGGRGKSRRVDVVAVGPANVRLVQVKAVIPLLLTRGARGGSRGSPCRCRALRSFGVREARQGAADRSVVSLEHRSLTTENDRTQQGPHRCGACSLRDDSSRSPSAAGASARISPVSNLSERLDLQSFGISRSGYSTWTLSGQAH